MFSLMHAFLFLERNYMFSIKKIKFYYRSIRLNLINIFNVYRRIKRLQDSLEWLYERCQVLERRCEETELALFKEYKYTYTHLIISYDNPLKDWPNFLERAKELKSLGWEQLPDNNGRLVIFRSKVIKGVVNE